MSAFSAVRTLFETWEAVEQQAVGIFPKPEYVPPDPLARAPLLVAAIHKLGASAFKNWTA